MTKTTTLKQIEDALFEAGMSQRVDVSWLAKEIFNRIGEEAPKELEPFTQDEIKVVVDYLLRKKNTTDKHDPSTNTKS